MTGHPDIAFDREALRFLPAATAVKLCALPMRMEENDLVVGMSENHDPLAESDVAFVSGRNIIIEVFRQEELVKAIHEAYGVNQSKGNESGEGDLGTSQDSGAGLMNEMAVGGSVVSLVNKMISDAIRLGASDIHIEPYEKLLRVRYRLDGVLKEVERPQVEQARAIISRLKIMADLDIAEKRRPQDGRIRVKEGERMIDIRVSSLPTDFGEKIVLRILDKSQLQLDLTKLGFEDDDLKQFQRTLRLPYGMILVTGPTGSGKTTTLYAALNSINRPEINITTIEDPIEYNLPGINQTHVRSDIGLTFAAALRSILRQDPNVIMLGEIRDGETANIAIRAALTGHLVLSTLHTNDSLSAIARLTDMGVEPFLVAASVKLVLAQRLLRRVCPACAEGVVLATDQCDELGVIAQGQTFVRGRGCPSCHQTGYRGRTAVYEILALRNDLSDVIARGATLGDLRRKVEEGIFVTLRKAAIAKGLQQETTVEEILRET